MGSGVYKCDMRLILLCTSKSQPGPELELLLRTPQERQVLGLMAFEKTFFHSLDSSHDKLQIWKAGTRKLPIMADCAYVGRVNQAKPEQSCNPKCQGAMPFTQILPPQHDKGTARPNLNERRCNLALNTSASAITTEPSEDSLPQKVQHTPWLRTCDLGSVRGAAHWSFA